MEAASKLSVMTWHLMVTKGKVALKSTVMQPVVKCQNKWCHMFKWLAVPAPQCKTFYLSPVPTAPPPHRRKRQHPELTCHEYGNQHCLYYKILHSQEQKLPPLWNLLWHTAPAHSLLRFLQSSKLWGDCLPPNLKDKWRVPNRQLTARASQPSEGSKPHKLEGLVFCSVSISLSSTHLGPLRVPNWLLLF